MCLCVLEFVTMRWVWVACLAPLLALLVACAGKPPAPPATDPGPFPADHGQLFAAYLADVLQQPGAAQVTLLAAPTRYDAPATPLSPAVTTWAACYIVEAKATRGASTGARAYLALFRNGALYDVIVDEARTTATVRQELARVCAARPASTPAAAKAKPPPSRAATGSAPPVVLHPDGRPVIPGVIATTDASAAGASRTAPSGRYAYPAEQVARRMKCTFDSATLTGTGPGYETYGVRCDKDKVLVIRCDHGNCRAMP
jgi:hypothetical protein